MNLDFFNLERDKSTSNFSSNFINSFIKQLSDYLRNKLIIENGLYQVDRFEGDFEVFAVCQNLQTQKMCNIPKSELPQETLECFVLKAENGLYSIDYNETRKYVKDI
jgi:hypothetical protein